MRMIGTAQNNNNTVVTSTYYTITAISILFLLVLCPAFCLDDDTNRDAAAAELEDSIMRKVRTKNDVSQNTTNARRSSLLEENMRVDAVTGVPLALYNLNYRVAPQQLHIGGSNKNSRTGDKEDDADSSKWAADIFLREHLAVLKIVTTTRIGGSATSVVGANTPTFMEEEEEEELRHFATTSTPGGDIVRYQHYMRGIPVYDSAVGVTVSNNNNYRDEKKSRVDSNVPIINTITFVASSYKPGATLPLSGEKLMTPVTEKEAVRAAMRELGIERHHISTKETQLVFYYHHYYSSTSSSNGNMIRPPILTTTSSPSPTLAWIVRIASTKDRRRTVTELIYDANTGKNVHMKSLLETTRKIVGEKNKVQGGTHRAMTTASTNNNYDNNNTSVQQRNHVRRGAENNEHENYNTGLSEENYNTEPHRYSSLAAKTVNGTGTVFLPNPLASARKKYTDDGYGNCRDKGSDELDKELVKVVLRDITKSKDKKGDDVYTLVGPYAAVRDFEFPRRGCFERCDDNFSVERNKHLFEAVNVYYHLDTMLRYVVEELGFDVTATLPDKYKGGVRYDPSGSWYLDNSYYDLLTQQLSFGIGGVDDGEDADIIVHELGHGLHHWLTKGEFSNKEGLSEAFGDYLAVSYSRTVGKWQATDPEWNWVFGWDAHNEYWDGRVTNYGRTYPDGLTGDFHTDAQIFSSCAMQVWDAIGREKSDLLHLTAISYTGKESDQDDAAHAVVTAAINLNFDNTTVATVQGIYAGCGYSVSCGNGVRDGLEECEGNDLGSGSCRDVGCKGGKKKIGVPKCNKTCKLDYSTCSAGPGQSALELKLTLDIFPEETSWTVSDGTTGNVLFEDGPYLEPLKTHREFMCLDDGCYTFTIRDDGWEDGLYGNGGYDLFFHGTEIDGTDQNFGSSASHALGTC